MTGRSRRIWAVALVGACASIACHDTAQERLHIELFVQGTNASEILLGDGTTLILQKADLAFGPLYLCPGAQSGALCDTARLEWTESVVVDCLDGNPIAAGHLAGMTGPVRSYMYDLGFASVLTTMDPIMLEAARALGGASLVVRGQAVLDGESPISLPFSMEVLAQQTESTEQGQPVVRKSASDTFQHVVDEQTKSLTVRFEPRAWLMHLTADDFWAHVRCPTSGTRGGAGGAPAEDEATTGLGGLIGMAGTGTGGISSETADWTGCEVHFPPDSAARRGVRQALLAGTRPVFEWNR